MNCAKLRKYMIKNKRIQFGKIDEDGQFADNAEMLNSIVDKEKVNEKDKCITVVSGNFYRAYMYRAYGSK